MKWIPLKIFDYTSLSQEIEFVSTKHKALVEELDKNCNNDKAADLIDLQNEIVNRIKEINSFTERYTFDSRVSNFIKASKALGRIISSCRIKTVQDKPKGRSSSVTPTNQPKKILKQNTSDNNLDHKSKALRYSQEPVERSTKNQVDKNATKKEKQALNHQEEKVDAFMQNSSINKNAAEFSQWRELVFKIKLNPDEYALLIQEKGNRKVPTTK